MYSTVEEFFQDCDVEKTDLKIMESKSEYWRSAARFAMGVWNDEFSRLTERQVTWLEKIRDDISKPVGVKR